MPKHSIVRMPAERNQFYCLNWELVSTVDNQLDRTRGNEIIEIHIHDINGLRPADRYVFPIVQVGRPFNSFPIGILHPKDNSPGALNDIVVNIRILRGSEKRILYATDFILQAPYYIDRARLRIPMNRLWYWNDYCEAMWANAFSSGMVNR